MSPHKSHEELAEEFATFFFDQIEKIHIKFKTIPAYQPKTAITLLTKFSPITKDKIYKEIMEIKNKSCELDIICTSVFKQLLPVCIDTISQIVSLLLTSGNFCMPWKTAIVRPLVKKTGLELIHKNYYPISNLRFISKLVEQYMLKQLLDHCSKFNLLSDSQSAYRQNDSKETSLLKMVSDIQWGMENQEITTIIILDLSAAFDTVDHDILLTVLKTHFGIGGEVIKWFENYLRLRYFKIYINGHCSSSKELKFSISQGSCSETNIFTCYCALIADTTPDSITINGFADDQSIGKNYTATDKNQEIRTKEKLETTVTNIKYWMDTVHLKLNSDKTEYIKFGQGNSYKSQQIHH